MIDIHPPRKSDHTWTDFFIHIGTIVVGILLAIGLEQTVERIHEHHQLVELREGAITDARIYLRDVDQNRDADTRQVRRSHGSHTAGSGDDLARSPAANESSPLMNRSAERGYTARENACSPYDCW